MSSVRAFIVRPFGTQQGIDFDLVERELIAPVLDGLNITGRTTGEIARAGNIRVDMFERLALADIVIADISIHNANVYYELGIRHSLRPRTTVLIRSRTGEVPFDLRTDRYLEYSAEDPGGARDKLADAVRQSLDSKQTDSPVFLLVPALEATDPERLHPVPPGFREEVVAAQRAQDRPMLAVLAEEAGDFDWGVGGLRLVAHAQFDLGAWSDARATCEAIRRQRPDDPDANLLLGTVYNRLHDPVASAGALERVLAAPGISQRREAEARALLGRNAKDLWVGDWRELASDERRAAALRSPHLEDARTYYDQAFSIDQNHWYPGINALALTAVTAQLARVEPGVWNARFDDDAKAETAVAEIERARDELAAAVSRSLTAEVFRNRQTGEPENIWARFTRAELRLLTSDRPAYVADAYRDARAAAEKTEPFAISSAADQVYLYKALGLFAANVDAALEALRVTPDEAAPLRSRPVRSRVIVFAGHRVDAPGRNEPRFPPASEPLARELIEQAVGEEKRLAGDEPILGFAAGASGGDILFHEVCAELGIPTTLLLPLPDDEFAAASVADGGPRWLERFRTLTERLEVRHLTRLPDWLAADGGYTIWQRGNRWILHTALSLTDADIALIVLWDGKGGDGPGGTENMVRLAKSRGVKTVPLAASVLVDAQC
ncbi:MAG TPA: tetratricopeptide repeat-containing protein [Solirubrobacteraceae bacterium]|nr:tetratricopeptide repeat-containing protein [Solirubrobacteraceae bacterium]